MDGWTEPTGAGTEGANGFATGIVASLAGTGANIYDSYAAQQTAARNTDKTIEAQKQQAELAYQRQVASWNMQNAYNSPEAQMNRFKAAGLNPHLIYGQGTAGNATSMPQYNPPHLQYSYASGNYGQATASLLPTLMSVGEWMQDMKLKSVQIQREEQGLDLGDLTKQRQSQLIDYLSRKNPQALSEGENRLSLYPYQRSAQMANTQKAWAAIAQIDKEYEYKFGRPLFKDGAMIEQKSGYEGVRKLQFLEQLKKNTSLDYKNKLLDAQSSWSDADITNPQHLVEMVLGAVSSLAGQRMRLSTMKNKKYRESSQARRHYEQMRGY
jgi:hypothetical protein